jgi:hypothetical protein
MTQNRPELLATLKNAESGEVRHLVIVYLDGSKSTQLVQFTDGVEAVVDVGTEYEVKQTANARLLEWPANGFKSPKTGYAFEKLEHTVALAKKLGFNHIQDDRCKDRRWPDPNLTGVVPLSSWPGVNAKNGGSYLYALDHMRIYAQPQLPPGVKLTINFKDIASLSKVQEALALVGPHCEFALGGYP